MNKRWLKKKLPDVDAVRNHRFIRLFGRLLHDANLWHLNRRSIPRGLAVGVFCAFLPVPFQMVIAAGFAIGLRANLPLAVASVWVSNPITMPPMMYLCYKFGAWLFNQAPITFHFELSIAWLSSQFDQIVKPLLSGCLLLGLLCACLSYMITRLLWRISITKAWQKRQGLSDNH